MPQVWGCMTEKGHKPHSVDATGLGVYDREKGHKPHSVDATGLGVYDRE